MKKNGSTSSTGPFKELATLSAYVVFRAVVRTLPDIQKYDFD